MVAGNHRRMMGNLLSPGILFLLKPAVGRLPKGVCVIISGGWTNLISVICYAAVLIVIDTKSPPSGQFRPPPHGVPQLLR